MGDCNKIVLRLVPDRAVVLNSRERAPFVLFVETMEIPDSSSDDTDWPRHSNEPGDEQATLDSSPHSPFASPVAGDGESSTFSQLARADTGSPLVSAAPVDDAQTSSAPSVTATELTEEELNARNVATNGVIDRVPSEEALRQMMSSMHVTNLAEPRERGLHMRVYECASAASRASSCVGRLTTEGTTSIGGSPPVFEGSFRNMGPEGVRGRRASMSDLLVMRESSICTRDNMQQEPTEICSRHANSSSPVPVDPGGKPGAELGVLKTCGLGISTQESSCARLKRTQSCNGASPCSAMPGRSRQSTTGSNSSWVNVDDDSVGALGVPRGQPTVSAYGESPTSNFATTRGQSRKAGEDQRGERAGSTTSEADAGHSERSPSTVGGLLPTRSAVTRASRQQQLCQLTEEAVQHMSRTAYVEHVHGARLSDIIAQVRKMSPYGGCALCHAHCLWCKLCYQWDGFLALAVQPCLMRYHSKLHFHLGMHDRPASQSAEYFVSKRGPVQTAPFFTFR
jgi:hypothetical protein